ncbi:hypothetical protein MPSI1_000407 [Malassezia psittaci]|uniref:Uncharacterized protein n=1 Tax=Malassezia psittaci TaxID=1821823 RepID=A0AAF0F8N2_9BASI|nr:hypothetical protein MPSI1_000407 [Malassezia psittaci]
MSETEEQRCRLERLRSAKRALRKYQQRREREHGKRASRTLRASIVLQGADAPTLLTQSFRATNHSVTPARESAQRALEEGRRRHSRTISTTSQTNLPASQPDSSSLNEKRKSVSGTAANRRSVHARNPSLSLPSHLPPPIGLRPRSIIFSHQPRNSTSAPFGSTQRDSGPHTSQTANSKRHSRHSRQMSIATRRESFEVMSGRRFGADAHAQDNSRLAPRAGRGSVRFSALEAASVLFNASTALKPLPPVPQEWRAGLWDGDDNDEGEDRTTALEKLEGRANPSPASKRKSIIAPRTETLSWLQPDREEPPHSSPPALGSPWNAHATISEPLAEDSLETLKEEDEEESSNRSRTHWSAHEKNSSTMQQATNQTAETGDEQAVSASSDRQEASEVGAETSSEGNRALRLLRLSSLQSSGTPLLGTTRRASTAQGKNARRTSNIYYKPASMACSSQAERKESFARRHHARSSRSEQSSNTSWPVTEVVGGALFSPDLTASESPGATSIESNDPTPQRTPKPVQTSDPVLQRLQTELHGIRERHLHEIDQLHREVEEVRHMMGAQLANVIGERDKAQQRVEALEKDNAHWKQRLEETESERDMYAEDIEGWRARCSELEQTIRSQQLRSKQEQAWRQAATERMHILSNRLKARDESMDSTTAGALWNADGSFSSMPSIGADCNLSESLYELPSLPEMPSENELEKWSLHVARQLSKHAPDSIADQEPAPETVQLLADMRQQIMALYSELKLEKSNHEVTRAHLHEAQSAAPQPSKSTLSASPVLTFTPADSSQASIAPREPPSTLQQSTRKSSAAKRRRHAFLLSDIGAGDSDEISHSTTDTNESSADVLFEHSKPSNALVGLGLGSPPAQTLPSPISTQNFSQEEETPRPDLVKPTKVEPAWPETSQDTSWLEDDPTWLSHTEEQPIVTNKEQQNPIDEKYRPSFTDPAFVEVEENDKQQASKRYAVDDFSPFALDGLREVSTESNKPATAIECESESIQIPKASAHAMSFSPPDANNTADSLFVCDDEPRVRDSAYALFGPVSSTPNDSDKLLNASYVVEEMNDSLTKEKEITNEAQLANSYDGTAIEIPSNVTQHVIDTSPDLEAGDSSEWVDEEDQPTTPEFPRPEFIPEWSFEQAMFEAAQDIRVYELSGRKPCSKQSRRGAARVRPPPVEDFFGILNTDGLKPALPAPTYALEMPPLGWNLAQTPISSRKAALRISNGSINTKKAPSLLGKSTFVDETSSMVPMKISGQPSNSVTISGLYSAESPNDPFNPETASGTEENVASYDPYTPFSAPQAIDADLPLTTSMTGSPLGPNAEQSQDTDSYPFSQEEDPSSAYVQDWPVTSEFDVIDRLAPSIPAPSTPVPRSPDIRLASPQGFKPRLIRPNVQTRIPVPTPTWKLDFTLTTSAPYAHTPFTI